MLITPYANSFGFIYSSIAGVQPSANLGTEITPAEDSFGSWFEVVSDASVTTDIYEIEVHFNSNNSTGAIRDTLVNIGIDPAGGTSYTTIIPNLLASNAVALGANTTPGIKYTFPVFIPSGSAIAAQASINNATVGTLRCFIVLKGKPSRPELLKVGTKVISVGVAVSTSQGTEFTSGTTSEGTYTSLGTTTYDCFYWTLGFGCDSGSMASLFYYADLGYGDGSTTRTIIEGQNCKTLNSEQIQFESRGVYHEVPTGSTMMVRAQANSTPDVLSAIAYGVVS